MEEFKAQTNLLKELQEKDLKLDHSRSRTSNIPEQIEEQNALVARYRAEFEEYKKSVTQHQLQRKEKEMELAGKEEAIRKHGNELNAVKTNEAYRALLSEIEKAKQDKAALEDAILEIMDAAEKESANIKTKEKELKQKEADSQAVIARAEEELKKFQNEVVTMAAERAEFARRVPAELLKRYEFIREARNGIAIVPIINGSCGGCHITLRPATINEVYKEQDLIPCDNCQRILYKQESVSPVL